MNIETNTNVSTNTEAVTEVVEEVKAEVKTGTEIKPEATTKPEVKPEVNEGVMIPKKRFDEVNTKYKELSSQVAEMEKMKEALQEQLNEMRIASEATKTSISEEKTKLADQVKHYETLVQGMVETKVADIPEDMRELIPEGLTVEQKLTWLNKAEAKGLFKKQVQHVEIGKPLNHSADQDKAERIKKMNPLQLLTSYYGEK